MSELNEENKISGSLQENLLLLLCYDSPSLPLLTTTLEVGMFENEFYRTIASACFDYYREFKEAPNDHIADLMEVQLTGKEEKVAKIYERILVNLVNNKENFNSKFILSQLNKFVRQQKLKGGVMEAHRLIKDGNLDEAEQELSKCMNSQIAIFDPGIFIRDTKRSLGFLKDSAKPFPIGIKPLDNIGFGPALGQLLVILGPSNRGKSISLTSRVWIPEHGYVTMKNLMGETGFNVLGVEETNAKVSTNKVIATFSSGIKPTCDIYLRSGRIINGLADTHPVLTWNGYVPTKDLKVGDFTVGSSSLPLTGKATAQQIKDCYVLGAFIGDGCLVTKDGPRLYLSPSKQGVADFVINAMTHYKDPRIENSGSQVSVHFKSDAWALMDEYNLSCSKSVDKYIPKRVYQLGKEALAACLAGIFDTDGFAYTDDKWCCVEFSTSSYRLSENILTALNVMGIYPNRKEKLTRLNGKVFKSWMITFKDQESIQLFSDQVGIYCQNQNKLERINDRTVTDKMLVESCQFFKRIPYKAAEDILASEIGKTNELPKWRLSAFVKKKNRLHPTMVQQAARFLNNQKLQALSSGDFVFDEITKIIWNKPELCWDMQTEATHQSFLCEHVFTHNSWALSHIGKMCAMQRLKVCHISLEMSEEKTAQRYFQSLCAISKRESEIIYTMLDKDADGRLNGFRVEQLTRPTLKDEGIEKALIKKAESLHQLNNLLIKRFPTNALTIKGLEAYLDGMDRFHHYNPQILVLDYADLLFLDVNNIRISTGWVYKELRRIAVERNIAVVTASQSNRLGEDSKVISLKHLAEDYSKAGTADDILAYCQTSLELRFGLARLFLAKARDEEREQTVLITQAYRMGQFCLDSTMISDRYWTLLDAHNTAPEEAPVVARTTTRRQFRSHD